MVFASPLFGDELGNSGIGPAAAQRFDELHAGGEALPGNASSFALRSQRSAFAFDDFEVTHQASPIAGIGDVSGLPGAGKTAVLRLGLQAQEPGAGQRILDFLERDENPLAIVRDILLKHRFRALEIGAVATTLK